MADGVRHFPPFRVARFRLGRIDVPKFPVGECEVYLSVGKADGTPVLALPIGQDDGARRYRIGTAKIVVPPKDSCRSAAARGEG